MTKRLQVQLEDDEFAAIQAIAKRRGQTTAAFAREALRTARAEAEYSAAKTKLRAVRKAAEFTYPTAQIDQLLSEIESEVSRGA